MKRYVEFFVTIIAGAAIGGLVFWALSAFVGCNQPTITAPTDGFRCGPQAQVCPGGCCTLSEQCGGVWPNCPKGWCCGDEDNGRVYGSKRRRMTGFAVDAGQ